MTFEQWLIAQQYEQNVIRSQLSRVESIRRAYPDLDAQFERDALASLRAELSYSRDDERNQLSNPSRLVIDGSIYNGLASYRSALNLYLRYKQEAINPGQLVPSQPPEGPEDDPAGDLWPCLERPMQRALRQELTQLEAGLRADDDGVERRVASGFIDITARDARNNVVVIELKTGKAGQRAVAQILSYMGDVAAEEGTELVRGMLVAFDFDHKAKAAAKMVPSLELVKYEFRFGFSKA